MTDLRLVALEVLGDLHRDNDPDPDQVKTLLYAKDGVTRNEGGLVRSGLRGTMTAMETWLVEAALEADARRELVNKMYANDPKGRQTYLDRFGPLPPWKQ